MYRFTLHTIAASLIIGSTIGCSPTTIATPDHSAHTDHSATPSATPAATPQTTPSPAAPIADHDHASVTIPDGQPVPTIKLIATPDAVAGWNLEIKLTNFTFNPAQVNQSSRTTEGHGHLLLNGRKVARIYGTWNHIPKLPKGSNVLTVMLMTNKHETIMARQVIGNKREVLITNPQPIVGQVTIDVP